jgi:Sec-independent protein secretion pathway component TatC
MGGPMYVLYEICIWIATFMERKEKKANKRPPMLE